MSATTKPEIGQACLKWGGGTLVLAGPCVIGRRSDNDLQINNVQVSRRHALVVNVNDDWWLNDLGSRNGVLINGLRLSSARRLRDGDEIRIANHRIIFSNSNQSLPSHSSIVGKTTQVSPQAYKGAAPSAVNCDLIIATTKGEVIEGEKAAHWIFGKSMERLPGAEKFLLPPAVRQWLTRLDEGHAITPFEFQKGDHRVIITVSRRKEDRCFLLVREESASASYERLKSIGLTEREAEVMHWVCEGKQNSEIAQILSVTLHTVNRHLEHIFKKLGVDNRQKAIKTVMDRLAAL